MRINNNASANTIWRQSFSINKSLDQSLERLSSGVRLNRASDGASDIAIADRYRARGTALGQGERNIQTALNQMNTIDSALAELSDIAQRGLEMSMAYASTSDADAQDALESEWIAIYGRVEDLVTSLSLDGVNLGGIDELGVRVDDTNTFNYETPNIDTDGSITPNGGDTTAVTIPATMSATVSGFQDYVDGLAKARATLGGSMRGLEAQMAVNMAKRETFASNESLIRDTDVAQESTRLTRAQILSQSNVAMLAQANARPLNLLALLR
jgi:flagellin